MSPPGRAPASPPAHVPAVLRSLFGRPLVQLAAVGVAGILADSVLGVAPWALLALACVCAALALTAWAVWQRVLVSWPPLLLGVALLAAALHGDATRGARPPYHLSQLPQLRATFAGHVLDGPLAAADGRVRYRVAVEHLRVDSASRWELAQGRLRVTLGTPPARAPLPGDHVLLRARLRRAHGYGNPGCADRAALLAARGVDAQAFVPDGAGLVLLRRGAGLRHLLGAHRARLARWLDASLPEGPGRELVRGLALGDPGGLRRDHRAALAATGTAHLLALSGLHVGVVAAVVYWLLLLLLRRSRWLLLRMDVRRAASAATLAAVALYTVFCGAALPTVRAAVMVGCYLLARLLGRAADTASAYALAAVLLLFAHPPALFDPSFQLSFGAVAAVLLLTPRLLAPLRRFEAPSSGPRALKIRWWLLQSFAVSSAASLGTWPVIAAHFHQLALVAPLANLLLVPLVSLLLLPLCLALPVLQPVAPWVARWVALLAGGLGEVVSALAGLLARLPGAGLSVAPPGPELLPGGLALLVAALAPLTLRRRALLAAAGLILLAPALLLPGWLRRRDPAVVARLLDVGQGDATLLRLPGGFVILVDTGGAETGRSEESQLRAELALLPALRAERVDRIDLLVLTHPHPDHYGSAPWLLDAVPVERVWVPAGDASDGGPAWAAFLRALRRRQIPVDVVASDHPGLARGAAHVRVLSPPPGGGGLRGNDRSIVLSVRCGESGGLTSGLLLAGDLQRPAEALLVQAHGPTLRHAVLKVGHHGSSTSSGPDLLAAVRPRHAFFSVGAANGWGFPHRSVWRRFGGLGTRRWRSDEDGSLEVRLEPGGAVQVTPWRQATRVPGGEGS